MLLYRSYLGRRETWEVRENEYDRVGTALGRMPIVIHLGDFLQLKPTAAKASLVSDFSALAAKNVELAPEFQSAMTLFCNTPLCFEFQASNRFKDPKLRELMDYMRAPKSRLPASVKQTWQRMCCKPNDGRPCEERFQNGHMIGSYWDTVSRWMNMRAARDAKTLKTPLFLIQAADRSSPVMTADLASKLMNKASPKETGNMHGLFAAHLGMHVRLLEALDLKSGLVKDAEGRIVDIVVNPLDQPAVDNAFQNGGGQVYLKYLPLGIWVRMQKYTGAPFTSLLAEANESLDASATEDLVFIEPSTSEAFTFRQHKVVRTAFYLTHGRVITTTACQGRTMKLGVIVDCGRHDSGRSRKEDDDWWLDLYVMLSRATRSEDLLLVRPPPVEFLTRGPPVELQQALLRFARRQSMCRTKAASLAKEFS